MGPDLTIADVSSLIVAASAVAIAFWNGYAARKHYRLSVRPRLRLRNRFRDATAYYGVRIVNGGLGPAVVKDIRLVLDGGPVDYSHQGWIGAIKETGVGGQWSVTRLLVDTVILNGEDIWLFRTKQLSESANEVIKKLGRIEIVIRYESLYGEEQPQFRRRLVTRASLIEESQSEASSDA